MRFVVEPSAPPNAALALCVMIRNSAIASIGGLRTKPPSTGDHQQSLQLLRNVGVTEVCFRAAHEFFVAVQMRRRNGAMER